MLDMGFIHDIRRIVGRLPQRRQTLFFSATMPKEIAELADSMARDPVRVAVTPAATTVERIDQRVMFVDRAGKPALLAQLLRSEQIDRVLVFTRTKHGADKVVRALAKSGLKAAAIHGNKSQNQRERVLAAFRSGEVRTLIATDIAARGIDVEGISHVVNYDLPNIPESYVHRIGRTARAGADGVAISFCDGEERAYLRDIEKLIRITIPATDQRNVRHAEPHTNGNGHRPHGREHQHPASARKASQPKRSHGHKPQRAQTHRKPNGHKQQTHQAPLRRGGDGSIESMPFMQPAQRRGHRAGQNGRRSAH
jgi:superfamily II DNA/RNA helicase